MRISASDFPTKPFKKTQKLIYNQHHSHDFILVYGAGANRFEYILQFSVNKIAGLTD